MGFFDKIKKAVLGEKVVEEEKKELAVEEVESSEVPVVEVEEQIEATEEISSEEKVVEVEEEVVIEASKEIRLKGEKIHNN